MSSPTLRLWLNAFWPSKSVTSRLPNRLPGSSPAMISTGSSLASPSTNRSCPHPPLHEHTEHQRISEWDHLVSGGPVSYPRYHKGEECYPACEQEEHTYIRRVRGRRLGFTVPLAALESFLQVLVASRRSLRCHPADDGYERHADPVPLEVKRERDTRSCAVVERFDGEVRVWPDRSSDTVSGPAPGRIVLRYFLGHRPLSATDSAGSGEP